MKLTLRQRFVIWASDKPWISRVYVARATRNDIRLAEEEFDKVTGINPVRRPDGTVAGEVFPASIRDFHKTHTEPGHIEVPLDRVG